MVCMVSRGGVWHCFTSDRGHHDTMIGYVAVISQYPNLGMEESGLAHLKGL